MLDDLYVLRERARLAATRGDLDTAAQALVSAASQTHVAEHDYVSILKPLEDVLTRRADFRGALTVLFYLAFGGAKDEKARKRARALLPSVPPLDRARVLGAEGEMEKAAREMEDAGLVAAAAIYRERANDWKGARALWSRLATVASLAREAAEYARSLGLTSASAHYTMTQAALWREVSKQHTERGAPSEIAENALLAAILAFGEVGQFARVGELYTELGMMDLDPLRRAHYARAAN